MRNAIDVARRTRVVPPPAARPLIALVFEGLSEDQKQLPSMLLFDAEGSRLFERVCEQPEYYLGRAEASLLRRHAAEIRALVGPQAAIVEYGAGAGTQGALLLDALTAAHSYVPIDVEASQLVRARETIRARRQALRVTRCTRTSASTSRCPPPSPARVDAWRSFRARASARSGNWRPSRCSTRSASRWDPMAALLVGIDLLKDRTVHERACNDAAGAMAAFNRNVLVRLNREIDATFDPEAFEHCAVWNEDHHRIEMGLVSTRDPDSDHRRASASRSPRARRS